MFKKTITYKDWNGEERTEDFRFNLSKTDIQLLNASMPGGLFNYMKTIYDAKDIPKMMEFFVELIMKAYGEISPDGRRFVKDKEVSKAFQETVAFDEIFQWLFNEKGAINEFLLKTVPVELSEELEKTLAETKSLAPAS